MRLEQCGERDALLDERGAEKLEEQEHVGVNISVPAALDVKKSQTPLMKKAREEGN